MDAEAHRGLIVCLMGMILGVLVSGLRGIRWFLHSLPGLPSGGLAKPGLGRPVATFREQAMRIRVVMAIAIYDEETSARTSQSGSTNVKSIL